MRFPSRPWVPPLLVLLALGASTVQGRDARGEIASALVGATRIDWAPLATPRCLQLTVTGPDLTFQAWFDEEAPSFELPDEDVRDGSYAWELSRSDHPCRAQLVWPAPDEGTAAIGDDANGRPRSRGGRPERTPAGPYIQSGHFRVEGGLIVVPTGETEAGRRRR